MYASDNLPVLIVAFKRPEMLKMVLHSLGESTNPVYIWLDGPRNNDEAEAIRKCVDVIDNSATLNLVKVFHSPANIGIGYAIPRAIQWVFSFESAVVILEDDVLVDPHFFHFAASCLESFRDDYSVTSIIGFNCVPKTEIRNANTSYRFSTYTSSWAWATWRSKWNELEPYMLEGSLSSFVAPRTAKNFAARIRWLQVHKKMHNGLHVSWDHRWLLTNWSLKKIQIVSNNNYCVNIGFGADSTHTVEVPSWMPNEIAESFSSRNDSLEIEQDTLADHWMAKHVYKTKNTNLIKHSTKIILSRILQSLNIPLLHILRRH